MPNRRLAGRPRRRRSTMSPCWWPAFRPRPRSGTATTANSSPLAAWTVMTRTPSWPSAAHGGHPLPLVRLGARLRRRRGSRARSRPSCASNSRARRISLRTLAIRAGAARALEQGEVVAERRHRALDQALQRQSRGAAARRLGEDRAEPLEACGWSAGGIDSSHAASTSAGSRLRRRRSATRPAGQTCGGPRRPPPRSSQSASGLTPQAGEARAPKSVSSSSGLAITASSRTRPRPAAGTSSRGRRRRRARGRRARARPRRRRRG